MTNSGDLWLFVDGVAMVHIQGAVPMKDLPFLHPVVDVFAPHQGRFFGGLESCSGGHYAPGCAATGKPMGGALRLRPLQVMEKSVAPRALNIYI